MEDKIRLYIEQYLDLKNKIMGELNFEPYQYLLSSYFSATYVGQKAWRKVERQIQAQINHRKQQAIDLKYNMINRHYVWKRIEVLEHGYRVEVKVDKSLWYEGTGVETTYRGICGWIEVCAIGGKLKIEREALDEGIGEQGLENSRQETCKDKKKNRIGVRFRKEVNSEQVGLNEMIIKQMPKGYYNREKAVAYAKKYALTPNVEKWKNYERYGGDCTNFVSQCIYEGGIPFDHEGQYVTRKWYWYSDSYRTPSWTSANALKDYMVGNEGFGLVCELAEKEALEIGDIVQLGDLQKTTHSMLVVGKIYDKEIPNKLNDLLIAQHSTDEGGRGYNIPLSTKTSNHVYYKILGYNPKYV